MGFPLCRGLKNCCVVSGLIFGSIKVGPRPQSLIVANKKIIQKKKKKSFIQRKPDDTMLVFHQIGRSKIAKKKNGANNATIDFSPHSRRTTTHSSRSYVPFFWPAACQLLRVLDQACVCSTPVCRGRIQDQSQFWVSSFDSIKKLHYCCITHVCSD